MMLAGKKVVLVFLFALSFCFVHGQTTGDYRSVANTSWSTLTTWERFNGSGWATPSVGEGYPGQFAIPAIVTIQNANSASISMDVSPANPIGSLTFSSGNANSNLTFSGTNSLTVTGTITINAPTTNSRTKQISVNNGSLTCGAVVMTTSGGSSSRITYLNVSAGTITVTGNITMNSTAANAVRLQGAGTLNLGGSITGGTLTTSAGSLVNYNGIGQTVLATVYYNLTLSGSGTVDISGVDTINENFILSGSVSTTAGLDITVGGSFTLGSGTTFTAGVHSHFVSGNWINNGGSFVSTGSTVSFDNAAQSIGGTTSTTFDNLILTGSGIKTLNIATFMTGDLSIDSPVQVNLNGITTHTAQTITLSGVGSAAGTWGSSTSGATNQSDTYFSGTGIITVASGIYYSRASGNWNTAATWSFSSGGTAATTFPTANDIVVIEGGFSVTVTSNAACKTLSFASVGANNTLTINSGITFSVSGNIDLAKPSNPNTNSIAVGAGTLNAGSITFTNAVGGSSRQQITISTGTVNVTGDITMDNTSTGTSIIFTGAGTLNAGVGIMTTGVSSGTLTTVAGSTVNYNGGNQTIKGVVYLGNVTLSGTGTKTLQTTTTSIGGNLTLSGTASTTTVASLVVSGNLTIGNGTSFTSAGFPLTVTGTTTVGGGASGQLNITSATGTKIFTGLVTVASGATWTNTADNSPVTFRGGITNNGTFNAGTGIHTFDTNNQQLTGTFSIPNVTVTTVTVTNNNTLTVSTALSGTGGLTQASNATLNIGGTSAISTLTASNVGNTVNYSGTANQTIKTPVGSQYVNISFNGTTASGIAAPGAATTLNVSGNWINNGTGTTGTFTGFNPNGGTINFNGTTTVSGSSTTSFNNLQLAAASTLTLPSGTVNVGGNLDFNATSTFNNSLGTVSLNGSGVQTISPNGKEFYTLQVNKTAGSVSLTSSVPIQHLLNIQSATAVASNGNLLILSRGISTANDGAIGAIPTGASVTGNVTTQRYMDAIGNTYRYLGVPVSSALPPSQWGSTIYTYTYTGATGAYAAQSTSSTLNVGTGYLIGKNMNVAETWSVSGPITTGPFTWNFSTEGWYLLGNPFASAIRWYNSPGVAWDATNIATTIAVTDNSVSGYPNYFRYWDTTGGSPSGWGTGPLVNGMVAMGQAFWVYAGAGGGSLTIREAAKENTLNGEFYRTESVESDWLTIALDNGRAADVSYLRIKPQASASYEFGHDLKKLRNPELNIFTESLDAHPEQLVFNAMNRITVDMQIPIGFEVENPGVYTLTFENTEAFPYGDLLYLIDTYEGKAVPISQGSYTFTLNKSGFTQQGRFYLSIDNDVPERKLSTILQVYPNPVVGKLTIDLPATKTVELLMTDAVGKKILSQSITGSVDVDMTPYSKGVYVVKLSTDTEMEVKRILKQ